MRRHRPSRAATLALVLASVLLGVAPAARASDPGHDLGYLTVTPQAGTVEATSFLPGSIPTFTTSAGCPAGSNSYLLHLSGLGLPSGGVVWTAGDAGFSSTGTFTISSGLSIGDATAGVIASALLAGTYVVRLDCIASAAPGVPLASAVTNLDIDGASNHWVADPNPAPGSSAMDLQAIQVAVPNGSLAISTPYTPDHPFDLGTLLLDANGNLLSTSAAFGTLANPQNGITVVDTRPGGQGWSVSASTSDFNDSSGDTINGENLGFTDLQPVFLNDNALQSGVIATDQPAAMPPVAPGDTGTLGLKGPPHTLASTDHGIGTVHLIGTMTLNAPTSTQPGTYTATVTFTIV
jgi:hypothetical protein